MADVTPPRLVWIDCEMTGLDPDQDELVEVAVICTDFGLLPLDEGVSVVIAPSERALAQMGDFVRSMHQTSGLLDELPSGLSLVEAEQVIVDYLAGHGLTPGASALAGNSVGTDRVFLKKFLPKVHDFLHYRNVDVSTIKELARHWYPKVFYHQPEKSGGHRALADIRESIRELDYYRRALFISDPGPTTREVKEAAALAKDFIAPTQAPSAEL